MAKSWKFDFKNQSTLSSRRASNPGKGKGEDERWPRHAGFSLSGLCSVHPHVCQGSFFRQASSSSCCQSLAPTQPPLWTGLTTWLTWTAPRHLASVKKKAPLVLEKHSSLKSQLYSCNLFCSWASRSALDTGISLQDWELCFRMKLESKPMLRCF